MKQHCTQEWLQLLTALVTSTTIAVAAQETAGCYILGSGARIHSYDLKEDRGDAAVERTWNKQAGQGQILALA